VHRETVPAREEAQSVPAQVGSRPADASSGDPQAENVPSAANGSQELAQAEDFLNGKKYPRDSAMAAKFLWKAVGKENPSAVLLLSDMYLTGDGVPKSCDQARLLLTAAARKGVPQAADELRGVLRSGCR
jgi:TPR repeat protein